MMDLVYFRQPIDFVTLVERLTEMNELDTVGGEATSRLSRTDFHVRKTLAGTWRD